MSEQSYVIMTDSCSDMPVRLIEELDLLVIPFPTRSEAGVLQLPGRKGAFLFRFLRNAQEGAEKHHIGHKHRHLHIYMANPPVRKGSYLSGLFIRPQRDLQRVRSAAAELREKYPGRKVYIVDTLCASLGQGLLVYLTALEKKKGAAIDEARILPRRQSRTCHWFTVDDLHHLHSGGRISKTTAVFGTMLNIKPLLHVNDEGKLESVSKVRGIGGALKALADKFAADAINPEEQTVFISHGDCPERAEELASMIKYRFPVKDIIINYIGPVIGSHSGPGTLAVFFLGKKR